MIDATDEPAPASRPRDVPNMGRHKRKHSFSFSSDESNEVDEWGR